MIVVLLTTLSPSFTTSFNNERMMLRCPLKQYETSEPLTSVSFPAPNDCQRNGT